MKIAQLVPTLHSGDAIGNNSLTLKDHFNRNGLESEIFYLESDSDLSTAGRHVSTLSEWFCGESDTVTLLHYALPSPLNELFRSVSGYRILIYHNITPPEYLRGYPHLQHISLEGRRQLALLKGIPHLCLADSEYNRLELEDMGFADTMEMPIFIDFDSYNQHPCPVTMNMFGEKSVITMLFVGRVTPSKCQHDLIRFYGYFKRFVHSRCRLIMVGKFSGFEDYLRGCTNLADRLKLGDVYFTGKVTHAELLAYYHLADLFVSMSEHEGFGVPLVEAMHLGVPVMAYSAGAVPYTLGGGGIVFHRKDKFIELSELAHAVITDPSIRNRLLEGQQQRLEYFSRRTIGSRWNMVLREKVGIREFSILPSD